VKRARIAALSLAMAWHMGCVHPQPQPVAAPEPAPFQQFVAPSFDWTSVKRVVLLPMANQTTFEHVSVEMQTNLAAELQRAGRFDIVMASDEEPGAKAHDVFTRGSFDELELLRIARKYDAQAVLFGNVTQYHPYAPPRVGLSLVMICPAEGVAIASADGLWDARELSTARQAQAYLQQKLSWRQGLLGMDRAMDSPDVYQRFVCQQIASSLMPPDAGEPPPSSPFSPIPPVPGESPGAVVPAGHHAPSTPWHYNPRPKSNPHSR
jgi:hypothetical protein